MRYICTSIVATLALAGTTKSDSEQAGGYTHQTISTESLDLGQVIGQIAIDLPRNRLVGSTQLNVNTTPNGIFVMDLDSRELQVGYAASSESENYAALAINTVTNTWYTYNQPSGDPATQIISIHNGEETQIDLPNASMAMAGDGSLYVDESQNRVYVVCGQIGGSSLFETVLLVLDCATNTWLSQQHVIDSENLPGLSCLAANHTTNQLYIGTGSQLTIFDMSAMDILHQVTMDGPISGVASTGGAGDFIYIACTGSIDAGTHGKLYEMHGLTHSISRTLNQMPTITTDVFFNPHDGHIYVAGNNGECTPDGYGTDPHSGVSVVASSTFKLKAWVPLNSVAGSLCGNGTKIFASWGPTIHGDYSQSGCLDFNNFEEIDYSTPPTGDLNGDGDVDTDDLSLLHSELGICQSDVNHDGATNIEDLLIMIEGWNSVCP